MKNDRAGEATVTRHDKTEPGSFRQAHTSASSACNEQWSTKPAEAPSILDVRIESDLGSSRPPAFARFFLVTIFVVGILNMMRSDSASGAGMQSRSSARKEVAR